MELITLNAQNQPAKLIENYDSLIWTERFNTVGDFQITTGNVSQFLSLLPEGTVVSLRETNVAMIVETHRIDRKKNQPEKLTITGRSMESVMDRRVSIPSLTSTAEWNVNFKQPSDVAAFVMKQCTGQHATIPPPDPNDVFPDTFIAFAYPADYNTSTGPTKTYAVPRQNLLTTVLQLIQTEAPADATTSPATPAYVQHGIRALRPAAGSTAVVVGFYLGTDRTSTVYFDATRDLLDDGSYLFSKIGSAQTAYVIGSNAAFTVNKAGAPLSGMARRVILVDGTASAVTNADALKEQGKTSLSQAKETAAFDGSINSDLSPYKYGVDYNLGDLVKLVGDYGLTSTARVTEYIRTEDNTGSKSYPTLVTVV